jgi:Flp pilus assembly protein TadD
MSLLRTTVCIAAITALTACGAQEVQISKQELPTSQESNSLRLARATLAGGDMRSAERIYLDAVRQSTGSIEPHLALADLYERTERPSLAVSVLEDAVLLKPDNGDAWLKLANAQINDHHASKALKSVTSAESFSPAEPRVYNTKGVALDSLGRYEEAQTAYEQAIRLDPSESHYIQNNLALSHIMSGNYTKAIRILEPLVAAPNASATVRQNLALAYGLKGDTEKALAFNLKDLPEDKAKENIEFYKQYASKRKLSAHASSEVDVDTAVTPVVARDIDTAKETKGEAKTEHVTIPEKKIAKSEPATLSEKNKASEKEIAKKAVSKDIEEKEVASIDLPESKDPIAAKRAKAHLESHKTLPQKAPTNTMDTLSPAAGKQEQAEKTVAENVPVFMHNGKLPSPVLKPLIQ